MCQYTNMHITQGTEKLLLHSFFGTEVGGAYSYDHTPQPHTTV